MSRSEDSAARRRESNSRKMETASRSCLARKEHTFVESEAGSMSMRRSTKYTEVARSRASRSNAESTAR